MYEVAVLGGGAAGFFAALTAKRMYPHARVVIIEKSAVVLAKVRVSGGGRCNVTHACFDPYLFVKNYPRGEKELLGPFHRFQAEDTVRWFAARGVELKTEPDGRMFPVTDSAETIICALMQEAAGLGVEVLLRQKVEGIKREEGRFVLIRKGEAPLLAQRLILATGSSHEGYRWAQELGHTIEAPVPSLFTFNVPTSPLKELSGIAFEKVTVDIAGSPFSQTGPLLITHFGFSGPAILKLSAWAARYLYQKNYQFEVMMHWVADQPVLQRLLEAKKRFPQRTLGGENLFLLPKNFWRQLLGDLVEKRWNDLSLKELEVFAKKLESDTYRVEGKTTHKEEFVTCGGVTLKEVNFKKMESKCCPGLFFAGEILAIDGITGGFNFQNSWTTGFIAGESVYA